MNPPTELRFAKLEQRLDNLEKQEREYTFTIRDIAHKATINLGIATAQEADIKEMKADITAIKATQSDHGADIAAIKATQSDHGELLKEIRQILKPGEE